MAAQYDLVSRSPAPTALPDTPPITVVVPRVLARGCENAFSVVPLSSCSAWVFSCSARVSVVPEQLEQLEQLKNASGVI